MQSVKRRRRSQMSADNASSDDEESQKKTVSETQPQSYEESRAERIKQNLQKMQKLGILDLRNSHIPPKRTLKPSRSLPKPSPPANPQPTRRSSRLQNVTPVRYSEVQVVKNMGLELEERDILTGVGSKAEIYTEEDEKKLGNTEKSWVLFVDGYGKDGKRIYDPVNGKTCHQCRQKTLGHHTHCCKCNKVQGQFCGDCLYMRYGEHVLEAIGNPNWICPACRGICNCSFCRQAKGWAPTGVLYKKISNLGFKSVAHYLIQTRRKETNLVKSPDTSNQVSARRLLQFSDMDPVSKESFEVNNNSLGSSEPQFEDQSADFKNDREKKMHSSQNQYIDDQISAKRSLSFSDGPLSQSIGLLDAEHKVHDQFGLLKPQCESKGDDFESKKEKEMGRSQEIDTMGPSTDTIDGKLRLRCMEGHLDNDFQKTNCEQFVNKILIVKEVEQHLSGSKDDIVDEILSEDNPMLKKPSLATEPNSDSIARRLKLRRRIQRNGNEFCNVDDSKSDVKPDAKNVCSDEEVEKDKEMLLSNIKYDNDINSPLEISLKLVHKRSQANGPNSDSIAGRLRQRRREACGLDEGQLR